MRPPGSSAGHSPGWQASHAQIEVKRIYKSLNILFKHIKSTPSIRSTPSAYPRPGLFPQEQSHERNPQKRRRPGRSQHPARDPGSPAGPALWFGGNHRAQRSGRADRAQGKNPPAGPGQQTSLIT
ncbi:hypothetical protein PSEUDO8AS_10544 [Pseudomonas sp. 8AS]|nr:hypothetical protein PSEUDO8AS_10544 [Pseudomonas sp. 8AS]